MRPPARPAPILPVLAVPALALLALLAAAAGLHAWDEAAYGRLRIAAGLQPFPLFLDLRGVTTAIECWARGVDVYGPNPCDPLLRPHIYSPLLLRLPQSVAAPWLTLPLGVAMAAAMAAALLALPAPSRWRPRALLLLAVASPVTIFALERANLDVLIFAASVLGALLLGGGLALRVAAYALFLLIGLLKFYPLALLALVLRERPPVAAALLAAAAAVTALAVLPLADEHLRALAGIHPHAAYAGTFGARQLAQGLLLVASEPAATAAMLAVAAIALATAWRLATDRAVAETLATLPRRQSDLLAIGALLAVGCFLAGQSVEYRAVFLVLALPALLALAGSTRHAGLFRAAALAVAWLLWDPLARRLVARLSPPQGTLPGTPSLALWTLRELLWWFVVAVLAGLLAALLRRRPA
jgi:hypothetical protein